MVILDIRLPDIDGYEVARRLRNNRKTKEIPFIFLTERRARSDKLQGLELGADDYIVKPISIPKLLARVRAIFRKQESRTATDKALKVGPIEIHPAHHIVKVESKEVFFPKKEFEVLLHLARYAGQVVKRESLLNAVWGDDVLVVDRTIDVHIRKIREKLGRYADYIETIKGVGYRLREQS